MDLSLSELSRGDDDKRIYRSLFLLICLVNIAFHFLNLNYFPDSFDPLWIRASSILVCLVVIGISYGNNRDLYNISAYFALILFLFINNATLLGLNVFATSYFYGSLLTLLIISFYCKRIYELLVLGVLNILAFVYAMSLFKQDINLFIPFITNLLFTGLAFAFYFFRRFYFTDLKIEKDLLVKQNEILTTKTEILEQENSAFKILDKAIGQLTFEFNRQGICTRVWYPNQSASDEFYQGMVGKSIYELNIPAPNDFFRSLKNLPPEQEFEFQSLLDDDQWYKARLIPVLNDDENFINSAFIILENITVTKAAFESLKEAEIVLLNEQAVAKMGSWWNDISTKELTWSNNLYTILEVTEIPVDVPKLTYYISLIHPEDKSKAKEYFTTIGESSLLEFEHRLITPKGNLKYFKVSSGYPIKDRNGKIIKTAGIIHDITESKLAEITINTKNAELVDIQGIAKIGGMTWDVANRAINLTNEVYHIFELKENEFDLDGFQLLHAYTHPNDADNVAAFFENYPKSDQKQIEYRIITLSGELKHIAVILGKSFVKDDGSIKILGTVQDISERKKYEFDFEQSENKYKTILENIDLAAVSIDSQGIIIFCNERIAKLTGYSRSQLKGMSWVDYFVAEKDKAAFRLWLSNGTFSSQHTSYLITKNGDQRLMNWNNAISYNEGKRITGVTCIGEDITEDEKLNIQLLTAKEKAEKSLKLKSDYLSIIGEELEVPMNAMIGSTNHLLNENPSPAQLEYLNSLQYSGYNLMELFNHIVDYNNIESGKLELNKLPFNLNLLANQVIQKFAKKAGESATKLELKIDDSVPKNLIGDQLRLSQILNNLLTNSVKFTDHGTITLNISCENMTGRRANVKFTLSDNGLGMEEKYIENIFDPFADGLTKTNSGAAGTNRMGLAITKHLIELYNSNIHLHTEWGKGTELSFAIVFDVVDSEEEKTSEQTDFSSLKGMNILVVDDNKMNLMIAAKFLTNWQACVEEAADGKIAIDMALHKDYDLIIMDLQMPVMDGFESAYVIKKTRPGVPIIALTADVLPETQLKAVKAGMDDFLTKPFVPEILFEKINKYYKPEVSSLN